MNSSPEIFPWRSKLACAATPNAAVTIADATAAGVEVKLVKLHMLAPRIAPFPVPFVSMPTSFQS